MAQSLFQDPPQAEGYWTTNLSKMAIIIWQMSQGTLSLNTSAPGQGASPAPAGFQRQYAYFGATNNVQTITYLQDSTVLGVVTFTYVNGGGSDDDDIATEVWTAS